VWIDVLRVMLCEEMGTFLYVRKLMLLQMGKKDESLAGLEKHNTNGSRSRSSAVVPSPSKHSEKGTLIMDPDETPTLPYSTLTLVKIPGNGRVQSK